MAVLDLLTERAPRTHLNRIEASIHDSDPYGIDVQLTLYVCCELHYRGFAEWTTAGSGTGPTALARPTRGRVSGRRAARCRRIETEATADTEMERLSIEPIDGSGPSYFLRSQGTWEQM